MIRHLHGRFDQFQKLRLSVDQFLERAKSPFLALTIHGIKGFVIPTKSFVKIVKIGITKIFLLKQQNV